LNTLHSAHFGALFDLTLASCVSTANYSLHTSWQLPDSAACYNYSNSFGSFDMFSMISGLVSLQS